MPLLPTHDRAPSSPGGLVARPARRGLHWRSTAGILHVLLLPALLLTACSLKTPQRVLTQPSRASTLDRKSPFLKVHLRDGGVCVLGQWTFGAADRVMRGEGKCFDASRALVFSGTIQVPLDSVALFETNSLVGSNATGGLMAMTVLTGAFAVYCLANPKACFGSCPTFYVSDGARDRLMAEGFSSSIAPALEATDLDALYRASPRGRDLLVRMTNEALETHVVRHVDILVLPRPPGGRVVAAQDGRFLQAFALRAPRSCTAAEGDILPLVRAFDGVERGSTADSTDLATRETIDIELPDAAGSRAGLVIAGRQSLMSTWLFYQGLSWLGTSAVAAMAALGRSGEPGRRMAGGIGAALGGIEVQLPDEAGGFRTVGELRETGPLASDLKVVPFPDGEAARRVRLRLTRGHWRLDYLALADLGAELRPIRCRPVRTERNGRSAPDDLASLLDSARTIVTLPGDEIRIHYRLPADPPGLELFLESRGYYLEWLREAWLAEENPDLAARLFLDPRGTLQRMAPDFKQREAGLDSTFWRSRYARP